MGPKKLLRKWFWRYFEVKNKYVLSVWKGHFSVFYKFLSNKVETVFWESETDTWKPIKFKVDHRKLFRKRFWSDLGIKNQCSERLEREICRLLQVLSAEVETILWESKAKHQKLFKSKLGHTNLLRKWFSSYLELKNVCSERLKRAFFGFLQIFEWRSETMLRKVFA